MDIMKKFEEAVKLFETNKWDYLKYHGNKDRKTHIFICPKMGIPWVIYSRQGNITDDCYNKIKDYFDTQNNT